GHPPTPDISLPSNATPRTVAFGLSLHDARPVLSNVSWITITGGASGTGIGTVTYSVATNTGASPRTGTLTIAGQTVTITQAANRSVNNPSTTQIWVEPVARTGSQTEGNGTAGSW